MGSSKNYQVGLLYLTHLLISADGVIDEKEFASLLRIKNKETIPDSVFKEFEDGIRNKKETIYCYSEDERKMAIEKLKPKPEITRFKGLGEISPDEFKHFIGADIRLDPVMLDKATSIEKLLEFYMGKNTPDRQVFIINNLKVELDVVENV